MRNRCRDTRVYVNEIRARVLYSHSALRNVSSIAGFLLQLVTNRVIFALHSQLFRLTANYFHEEFFKKIVLY